MRARIRSVGTSVPKYRVSHHASARFAAATSGADSLQTRKVSALYRRTGIEHRGSVLLGEAPGEDVVNDFYPPATSVQDRGPSTKSRNDRYCTEAPVLAEQAARAALREGGIEPDQVTHLVSVSCTGFTAPGIDIALIDRLGLPLTTQRVQVGFMGCHGAINGLRTARGLVASDDDAKVLICSVELCSLHYQYGLDADCIVSNALFADGAAALIVDAFAGGTDHVANDLGLLEDTGSSLVPDSRDSMTWRVGDHGYEMTLSAQVPHLIQSHLKKYLAGWLLARGESIETIGGWAVHPGGTRILSAVESALELSDNALDTSRQVLMKHGNMSSATMLFILQRFATVEMPKPWLMLGFGPGLEIEVALIR